MSTPLPIADSPGKKSLAGLLLIFLALVAGIVVAGISYHSAQTAQVRSKVERELSAIATLKVNELAAWRTERLSDARFLQRDETLATLVRECIAQPAAARPQAALTASLLPIQASHDYAALLFDAGGRVCFAAPSTQAPPAAALRAAVADAQQTGEVTFLDFYRNETSQEIFLALLVPIRGTGFGARPVGVLVMQIDPRPSLYATLQHWPLPSTTAEMLLVRREGNEAVVLNGSPAHPADALTVRIPLTRSDLLAVRAARGQEGVAEGLDHRAERVVAALRKIPDSPWSLVAHIDAVEAYAAVESQFHESLFIIVALILCVGTAMGLWWRNQFVRHYREKYLTIEAHRESEDRYHSLVESSMDAVLLTAPDGRILSANATACRMFGATEAELKSVGRAGVVDTTDLRLQAALTERSQTGRFRGELTMVRRDGTKFPAEVSSAVFSTSTGEACTSMVIHDITQRQRSEATLRLQSTALTSAANGIVITDRHGIIVWVNPAFTQLTGYTFDEAVGKNPRELVKSGEQGPAFYEELWATILAGHVWHGEFVNRRKDGSLYPEEQTITPVRDAAGEITHFIGIKLDLTERKRAEEARRASEQKFQSVFEQASVGVVIAEGPRGRFVNVNRRFCEMVGYTAEELLQLTSDDLTHPEDIAAGKTQVEQISRGILRDFSREKRFRKKDGSYMWARVNVAPLDLSDAGSAPRIGVVEDITDRKQAETALRESEERYRLLFESNPLPMWVMEDGTLRFLAVNEATVQHYGYTRDEFSAMTAADIRPPEDVPTLLKHIQDNPARRSTESRHRRKDGTIIRVSVVSSPFVFDGRAARLVLAIDITEKKLLEEKFLHAQRLESLGMLAAGIAHDLNNVLAPIVFAAPMLRDSLSTPRDLKILATLESSAARGSGLVKQILGFAHSTTGELRPVQVKHLMRDVVDMIEETFPKSIRLEQQIPSDLWIVQGNPTQIHQVLLNLTVNARDAMPEGGTLRIAATNRRLDAEQAKAMTGARPGAWLVIEIGDSGTGITPEVLAHIWDPFFTTKGVGKGTGLGLSTVRGIVASHHGFIALDTQPGHGSTFRVFFPALEERPAAQAGAADSATPGGHGELLLVVDDDEAVRDSLTTILTKQGYRILSASDGVEAISHFTTHSTEIALVITDVDMPHIGGGALARILNLQSPGLPLLVISGLPHLEGDASEVAAARKLAQAFLLKPFRHETLLATVHTLLHPTAKA